MERVTRDKDFLNRALESIEAVQFPVYKNESIDYLKKATNITDSDVLSLFESRYDNVEHIKKGSGAKHSRKEGRSSDYSREARESGCSRTGDKSQ